MGKNILTTYTVSVSDNVLAEVADHTSYHASYARGITSIEIPAYSKRQAWDIAMNLEFQVQRVLTGEN